MKPRPSPHKGVAKLYNSPYLQCVLLVTAVCRKSSSSYSLKICNVRLHAFQRRSGGREKKEPCRGESVDRATSKSFYVFNTPASMGCRGGQAVIYTTFDDQVYGMGHNCSNINILGFSRHAWSYKKELLTQPMNIGELSNKNIKDLSIGGVIGAAIAGCGTLLWWGLCSRRYGEVRPPHVPRNGRCKYFKVACGHRMMVALTESRKVYVWGQRMRIDPCTKVKCGPFSTVCLTKFRELRACGSNGRYYLGTDDRNKEVKTISRISAREAFADFVVLWGSDDSSNMAATTTEGEIFTWGRSPYPSSSDHRSYFEFFAACESTPGLTSVSFPSPVSGWTVANIITPRELRSVNVTDVLKYVYHRDRPDVIDRSVPYSSRVSTRDIAYLSSQITCEESGKSFILEKFFKDVYMHKQEIPPDFQSESSVDCLPFNFCSLGNCRSM
ncbi:hypothetical protein GE061_009701 [Apolygus lucorum]|uniref:Uncharacterized protein n=1 Tax=Apolygus lucorum TaxID=248454 RepID=A0A8S9Y3P9_APOLU|nr:hypothetical protein GE061_009701 [Apolygus lucorum]